MLATGSFDAVSSTVLAGLLAHEKNKNAGVMSRKYNK
jgi:hypothetical protein